MILTLQRLVHPRDAERHPDARERDDPQEYPELTAGRLASGRALHLGELARPSGSSQRSVLAIAGDDTGAKADVTAFLDSIGYDAYDVGPLSEGWRYQPDTPAYGQPYVAPGSEFPGPGHQATAELLKDKLDAAERHRHT